MTASLQHPESGYSLVELVVALLLLGMIAIAVESGLQFGARVWQRSQQSIGSSHQLDSAQSVLRTLLSHSVPRLNGAYVTFVGEPTALSFDAFPPQAYQSHGYVRVSLSVTRDGPTEKIVLAMQSLVDESAKKQAVIVDGLKGVRFAYLDNSGGSSTWLSYWRDRRRLPDAVRVITDDPSQWPTLIVRPLISQSSDCALDPVTMTCRSN